MVQCLIQVSSGDQGNLAIATGMVLYDDIVVFDESSQQMTVSVGDSERFRLALRFIIVTQYETLIGWTGSCTFIHCKSCCNFE